MDLRIDCPPLTHPTGPGEGWGRLVLTDRLEQLLLEFFSRYDLDTSGRPGSGNKPPTLATVLVCATLCTDCAQFYSHCLTILLSLSHYSTLTVSR